MHALQTKLTAKGKTIRSMSEPLMLLRQPPALLCLCFGIVIELPLESCLDCIVQLGMVHVCVCVEGGAGVWGIEVGG